MAYDSIIIDSIACESIVETMHYDEGHPDSKNLWDLQTISGIKIADNKEGLLAITSATKEILEQKYCYKELPMSLSCLLGACQEIDFTLKDCIDETDSIMKASSLLNWKKKKFCVMTGNSLLRSKLTNSNFSVFDLTQIHELVESL